jgi:hypothetical protein
MSASCLVLPYMVIGYSCSVATFHGSTLINSSNIDPVRLFLGIQLPSAVSLLERCRTSTVFPCLQLEVGISGTCL